MGRLASATLIVSNFAEDSISLIDVAQQKEVQRIYLQEGKGLFPPRPLGPHHIALDWNQKYLYVPNSHQNSVTILDLLLGKMIDTVYVGGCPTQIVLCKKYGCLYVANSDSNSIFVLNVNTLESMIQIPTGEMPHGMVLTKDQERVLVANKGTKSITEIQTRTNEQSEVYEVECHPWHLRLSYDGRFIFVVDHSFDFEKQGKICVYQLSDMKLMQVIHIGKMPVEVICDKKNNYLYVADSDLDCIHVFNLKKNQYCQKINVSHMPHGLEIDQDEMYLFATSISDNVVDIIDIRLRKCIGSIPTGIEPTSVLFTQLIN
ncbi:40-residue YVTN family beta-propeller repeat protein [Alkaliphilus metalliredigens QYMF]|uniref:40-residue YVTN family beta-propeller repeat protein n=1 Tax=Alkaliphilus metalliredigens (strain QYMF) TaxID=293826 RepID=A6TNK1_ALKMQ|nr:beta-propeller fold lactonase family protein [Alkaliphilus metalliredigens]ABR47769.1 40-residue YVTN family beta-propeller repeat protein [Alkaliphilus metalliredigens QYMF]